MKDTLNPRLCEGRILVEPHLGQTSWLRSVSRSARTTVLPSEYTSRVNTALDRQLPQLGLISRKVALRHMEGFAQFAIEIPSKCTDFDRRKRHEGLFFRNVYDFHVGLFSCLQSHEARELRSAAG